MNATPNTSKARKPAAYQYRVLEDRGGNVTLCVFNRRGIAGGKLIYVDNNVEIHPEQLLDDMAALDAGEDYSGYMEDESDLDFGQALHDRYNECCEDRVGLYCIAEGVRGQRQVFAEKAGGTGKKALCIPDEVDEDEDA